MTSEIKWMPDLDMFLLCVLYERQHYLRKEDGGGGWT